MILRVRGFFIVWYRCWKMYRARGSRLTPDYPWWSLRRLKLATITWRICACGANYQN